MKRAVSPLETLPLRRHVTMAGLPHTVCQAVISHGEAWIRVRVLQVPLAHSLEDCFQVWVSLAV